MSVKLYRFYERPISVNKVIDWWENHLSKFEVMGETRMLCHNNYSVFMIPVLVNET